MESFLYKKKKTIFTYERRIYEENLQIHFLGTDCRIWYRCLRRVDTAEPGRCKSNSLQRNRATGRIKLTWRRFSSFYRGIFCKCTQPSNIVYTYSTFSSCAWQMEIIPLPIYSCYAPFQNLAPLSLPSHDQATWKIT